MKIAAAQISGTPGDVAGNLRKIEAFAGHAKDTGCRLILFPEISDIGYDFSAIKRYGQNSWAQTAPALSNLAQSLGICIAAGVCTSKSSNLFNSLTVWNDKGEVLACYDKIHLFSTPSADESRVFSAGNSIVTFSLDSITFGLSICYDLRFPELYRSQALSGTQVMLLASAWPAARIANWKALCTARAVENQCFLLAANRVGEQGPFPFGGQSLFIGPTGELVEAASRSEELLIGSIDGATLDAAREAIPALSQRRPECYAPIHER